MDNFNAEEVPQYVIDELARMILSEVQTFYESAEGKELLAEWKAEQQNDTG